ncbi:MAG TPA: hypothetical protein VKD70_05680 [Candidatus Acidoferrum sp.]|nr:hypothetical protein [Candidatus Acidoferrum sp.]
MKRSQITLAGSKPFHLIANLTEKDSPDSDYQVRETWPQRTSTCFGEEHGRTELPPDRGKPGTESSINISVDETGKLTGAGPGRGTSDRAFFAMYGALTKWQFRPYLKDGKPQYFHGVLTLRLN